VLASLDAWQAQGHQVARAVVVRTYGSAPRREGAVLLLADDGRIAGSVSGGCVEGATVGHLEDARGSGLQRLVRFGVTDEQAWEVGLACGGTIDVLVQPLVPAGALAAARDRTASRAVVTPLPEGSPEPGPGGSAVGPGERMTQPIVVGEVGGEDAAPPEGFDRAVVEAARAAMARGLSTTVGIAGRQHFIEVFAVRPRLVIVGGVPVAQALARLARELDHEVIVIDGRQAFATPERFPDVDDLIVGWPDEVAARIGLGPADAVAVLSHDPKFDEPAITEALRRGCRYVGAIGSRKTQAARRARLLEAGLSEAQLERLHGPIGLDLGGRTPAETALAIMAEIVAARYEGSARPMSELPAPVARADGPAG
jgi:xanthine dehydrogenase accessory factor